MGAPVGNRNAAGKAKHPITDILRRIAFEDDARRLHELGNVIWSMALGGDLPAAQVLLERLDGKMRQVITHESSDDAPLVIHLAAGAALREKIRGILARPVERLVNGEDNDA